MGWGNSTDSRACRKTFFWALHFYLRAPQPNPGCCAPRATLAQSGARFALTPLRACLRQSGIVHFRQPSGTTKLAAEKHLFWSSSWLRARLRQQGNVIFLLLTAQLKLCPSER